LFFIVFILIIWTV